MKKCLSKLCNLLTAFIALQWTVAKGEVLNSQATFAVYQSDITQWLNDQTVQLLVPNQVLEPQVVLTTPYHATLSNVSFQGNVSLTWTKDPATNYWVFDGQSNNATIFAANLSVHDSFPVNVNGTIISVRVDAECQNLAMSMPGQWKVHGQIPLNFSGGTLSAPVQNFTLTPSSQVPTVSIAACQGPSGMAAFMNQQVANFYAQPAQMQGAAQTQLQQFVDSHIGATMSLMGKPVSFTFAGVNVSFTPTTGASQSNGTVLLDGPLVFTSAVGTDVYSPAKRFSDGNLSDVTSSGFVIDMSVLNSLPTFALNSGALQYQFQSSDIPEFQKFMQSRLEQLAVWQDLWSFPMNTVFQFNARARSAPKIMSMMNIYRGSDIQMTVPVDVVMSAPTQFGELPYVEFYSVQTPAKINLDVMATPAGGLQVYYAIDQLRIWYKYRSEFYRVRVPSLTIDTNTIASTVVQTVQNKILNFTIPDSAAPLPGYRMRLRNLRQAGTTYRIEMELQKK